MKRERLLTAHDVADLLGVQVGWVYRATYKGVIPRVVLGPRMIRFRPADIHAILQGGTVALKNEPDPRTNAGRTGAVPRVGRGTPAS